MFSPIRASKVFAIRPAPSTTTLKSTSWYEHRRHGYRFRDKPVYSLKKRLSVHLITQFGSPHRAAPPKKRHNHQNPLSLPSRSTHGFVDLPLAPTKKVGYDWFDIANRDHNLNAKPADPRPNLADLVRDLTGVGVDDREDIIQPVRPQTTGVELSLADLISDDNGEIVFFNDSSFRSLAIETDAQVVSRGQATAHRTAAGEDVSGFHYVTFENGLTLYFEDGLDLLLSGNA